MAAFPFAIARTCGGISTALWARKGLALGVAAAVVALNLAAPVVVLSIVRKPADFFTFNPWLQRLPLYLGSAEPLPDKLALLAGLKLAWVSADGPADGVEWVFVLDLPTLARVAATAALVGAYFALWSYRRSAGPEAAAGRQAGILGAAGSLFGLTTSPCTLAGCGAPVLPVLGLAFTGLPAATLTLFGTLSRVGLLLLWGMLVAAVCWQGFRVGAPGPVPNPER
jgi:hypothetical protein